MASTRISGQPPGLLIIRPIRGIGQGPQMRVSAGMLSLCCGKSKRQGVVDGHHVCPGRRRPANKDGFLDQGELEKAPGLKAALKQVDTKGDGKITADEINAAHRLLEKLKGRAAGGYLLGDEPRQAGRRGHGDLCSRELLGRQSAPGKR